MENQSQTPNIFNDGQKQNLTNATAVLVLGIISIVGCICYGIVGVICGIIALVLAGKDMSKYKIAPDQYTISSYNNLKAGRICAIIGLILSAIYLIFAIIILCTFGAAMMSHPDQIFNHTY